jgi:hypothetical protein
MEYIRNNETIHTKIKKAGLGPAANMNIDENIIRQFHWIVRTLPYYPDFL